MLAQPGVHLVDALVHLVDAGLHLTDAGVDVLAQPGVDLVDALVHFVDAGSELVEADGEKGREGDDDADIGGYDRDEFGRGHWITFVASLLKAPIKVNRLPELVGKKLIRV